MTTHIELSPLRDYKEIENIQLKQIRLALQRLKYTQLNSLIEADTKGITENDLVIKLFRIIRDEVTNSEIEFSELMISLIYNKDKLLQLIQEIAEQKAATLRGKGINEIDFSIFYNMKFNYSNTTELNIWNAIRHCLIFQESSFPMFNNMEIADFLKMLVSDYKLQGIDLSRTDELPQNLRTIDGLKYLKSLKTQFHEDTLRSYFIKFLLKFLRDKRKLELGIEILNFISPESLSGDIEKSWANHLYALLKNNGREYCQIEIQSVRDYLQKVGIEDPHTHRALIIKVTPGRGISVLIEEIKESPDGIMSMTEPKSVLNYDQSSYKENLIPNSIVHPCDILDLL